MSVATGSDASDASTVDKLKVGSTATLGIAHRALSSDNSTVSEIKDGAEELAANDFDADAETHEMGQMGAKRIGSLAIGIGVVGIVLNEMSALDVTNSTGVVDVNSIFETAGSGLSLLVVGVIIAAAAVLLNLWSGF